MSYVQKNGAKASFAEHSVIEEVYVKDKIKLAYLDVKTDPYYHQVEVEIGLTEYEVAFYEALAENESAVKELGQGALTELAKIIVGVIKENTTIDWTIREKIQTKMRRVVKRVLRNTGYPPDAQKLAELRVMETANAITGKLV